MSEWKTNYLNINGIKLHYYQTGGDKPSIILSHGITDNGLCWTPIVRLLEKNFDVIMVDARGHGLSEAVGPYTMDNLAKDLIGLIEALSLDKPILMGHSMGAQTSAQASAMRPDLVSKLILEDPPGSSLPFLRFLPNFILKRLVKVMFKRMLLNPLKGKSAEEMQAICRKDNPKWADEEIQPWVTSKIQLFQNNPEQMFDSFMKSASADSNFQLEMIQDIQCPVLLIIAEKGLTKKKTAQKLTEEVWKNSQYVEIQNAGHNIRRENLEDFMEAVNTFLFNH
ncbi:MAG: alpha/beta fold hydrolase [Candidatus Hodarchaeales archaeon]|jgi:pimeloyl-ACP methyl ester carboxylesterase